ncbi:FAD-dependent oxidoreductase [Fulvimonas yonginensis]|uniref:FAD-dependent monooxygenase n=1 Tax=Fulvimonas yonginensis TaxID=1495200 RepID=A0ABU8J906_9GAMM
MQIPERTEVMIVGAGPCGLALAGCLAQRRIEHVLIDRLREPRATSRAAAVQARTLEVLEPLGVSRELIRRGVLAETFDIFSGDELRTRISFAGLETAYPFVLLLPQDQTERVLEERLRALGGGVLRGCEAARLTDDDAEGYARVDVDTPVGPRTIRARYVIGADGLHSMVRASLGIRFDEGTYPQSFVLGDVRLDREIGPYALRLSLADHGILLTAPFGDRRYRLIGAVQALPGPVDAGLLQAMLDERAPRVHRARIEAVAWSSGFRVHHGVAEHLRAGNVFLVGDAAHVHSPAGGQGMNNGIQDAVLLADLLARVLRSGSAPSALDAYEAMRLPRAREVVAFTDRLTRALSLESTPARHLRDRLVELLGTVPALRHLLAKNLAELDER